MSTPVEILPPITPAEMTSGDAPMVLALADLLPDAQGEIVIQSDGVGTVGIVTDQSVTASGTVAEHVTASGDMVAGYRYYALDGGLTLYCPSDTTLVLGRDVA